MGEENNVFDLGDIAEVPIKKHQHRMPDAKQLQTLSAEEVNAYWDMIKAKQRKQQGQQSILEDVTKALPATLRALKLQQRAAEVGFDWPTIEPVFDKLNEEIAEIKHEIENGFSPEKLLDEVGDLLFVCVNLARHLKIDPETALRHTNNKFINRFKFIEEKVKASSRKINNVTLQEMEKWWDKAKKLEL